MEFPSEATWTDPRDDCPHPEWWHATDHDSTEVEVSELVAGFVRALQPEYVVETGTCFGQTAHAIGIALMQNGHGELDTIEIDSVVAQVAFRRCATPLDLPVTIQQMSSLDFVPRQQIDFAWFDSEMELRVPEFRRFEKWMKPKHTIVGFHDTGPHKGVLGPLVRGLGAKTLQLPTPRGVTFLQVGS